MLSVNIKIRLNSSLCLSVTLGNTASYATPHSPKRWLRCEASQQCPALDRLLVICKADGFLNLDAPLVSSVCLSV
jgi:hypothetical protein